MLKLNIVIKYISGRFSSKRPLTGRLTPNQGTPESNILSQSKVHITTALKTNLITGLKKNGQANFQSKTDYINFVQMSKVLTRDTFLTSTLLDPQRS